MLTKTPAKRIIGIVNIGVTEVATYTLGASAEIKRPIEIITWTHNIIVR